METTETIAPAAFVPGKQPAAAGNGRNYGLDVMRSIAILLVLVSHGEYLYYDHLPPFIGNNIVLTGHWGVQLFFVLSGFLIGSILIKEIADKGLSRPVIFNFWKRRWFRTLPNYYLFLAIYILLWLITPVDFWNMRPAVKHHFFCSNPVDLAYFPFFLQNFAVTEIGFMGHSWSLSVEEWFYLTLPLGLSLFFALLKKSPLQNRLLYTFTSLIVVFWCLRFAGACGFIPRYNKLSVIYNLDNIMLGVLMAWLYTYRRSVFSMKKILIIAAIPLFITGWVLQNKYVLTGHPVDAWDTVIVPLHAIAFACLLPWFHALKPGKAVRFRWIVTQISMASYSMYLVHFIILAYIIDTIRIALHIQSLAGGIAMFILFTILTIVLSSANYYLFEHRMTALREKFSRK